MMEESIDTSMTETKESITLKIDVNLLIEEYERINIEYPNDTEQ
jgi:hypothetical protein